MEVYVDLEDSAIAIAALDNMVRVSDDGRAGQAGHWISYRRWAPRGAPLTRTRSGCGYTSICCGRSRTQSARAGAGINSGEDGDLSFRSRLVPFNLPF